MGYRQHFATRWWLLVATNGLQFSTTNGHGCSMKKAFRRTDFVGLFQWWKLCTFSAPLPRTLRKGSVNTTRARRTHWQSPTCKQGVTATDGRWKSLRRHLPAIWLLFCCRWTLACNLSIGKVRVRRPFAWIISWKYNNEDWWALALSQL